jgi:hypothetical protein
MRMLAMLSRLPRPMVLGIFAGAGCFWIALLTIPAWQEQQRSGIFTGLQQHLLVSLSLHNPEHDVFVLLWITVGRPVTRPPPYRSPHAELPHGAPQSYSLRT